MGIVIAHREEVTVLRLVDGEVDAVLAGIVPSQAHEDGGASLERPEDEEKG